jgi:hypothetical protein
VWLAGPAIAPARGATPTDFVVDAGTTITLSGYSTAGYEVSGNVVVNGTLNFGRDGDPPAEIQFINSNTHSILGTGEIVFTHALNAHTMNGIRLDSQYIGTGGTITVGPDLLVHGAHGYLGENNDTLHNTGTIWADQPDYEGMSVFGLVNSGVVRSSAGGHLGIVAISNAATIEALAGGQIGINTGWVYSFTNTGTISASGAGASLTATNMIGAAGSLVSTSAGGTLTLNGPWTTAGSLSVDAGGTLALGGTFSVASLAHLSRGPSGTGTIRLTGTANASGGQTLSLDASTGSLDFAGGTLAGGTLRTRDGTAANVVVLGAAKTSKMSGVTLDGTANVGAGATLDVSSGGGLTLANSTVNLAGDAATLSGQITGSGSVVFNAAAGVFATTSDSNDPFVYGPGLTFTTGTGSGTVNSIGLPIVLQGAALSLVPGQSLLINGPITNTGTIRAANGGVLGFNPATLTNNGTLDVTGGIVRLTGNFTTASYRALNLPVTPIQIAGSDDNTGDTLTTSAAAPLTLISGATVTGGTLAAAAPYRIQSSGNVTLAGSVTLAGALTHSAGFLTVSDTLTGDGASISLSSTPTSGAAVLTGSSSTLAGTIDISFDGTGADRVGPTVGTLTLGPAVTVHTGTRGGAVGNPGSFLVNNGTISAQTPGTTLTVTSSTVTNNGTIAATNGSTVLAGAVRNAGTISVAAASVLRLGYLPSPNTGHIDVAGGTFILDYYDLSPYASLRQQLLSGFAGGTWTGTTGITSSTAAADPAHSLAVGYADASALLGLNGTKNGTIAGQSVDATTVILQVVPYGDANLDGKVNADDYALLDKGLSSHASTWWLGDFNYDGTVDQNDYLLIDTTYLSTHPASAPDLLVQRESRFGPAYVSALLTSIPEPSSVACLFAGLLFTRRRNARKTQAFRG